MCPKLSFLAAHLSSLSQRVGIHKITFFEFYKFWHNEVGSGQTQVFSKIKFQDFKKENR
jgi:hypothetical protein